MPKSIIGEFWSIIDSSLTTIPQKEDRATAATHLNAELAALCEYGNHWDIHF